MKVLAWLGNQLRPESLFSKDLDIDPFIASTPEAIQADYEDMQVFLSKKISLYFFCFYFLYKLQLFCEYKVTKCAKGFENRI
jgi:hypothetical protein